MDAMKYGNAQGDYDGWKSDSNSRTLYYISTINMLHIHAA